MTIGETFKQARKKIGLDLDEVAVKTKITKNFLEAIESDELDRLPGEVYARHFLKIYSRLVKIDEDIVISEYHQQYGVKPHFIAHQEQTRKDDAAFKRERRRNLLIVASLVLVLATGTLIFLHVNGTSPWSGDGSTPDEVTPSSQPRVTLQTEPTAKPETLEQEKEDVPEPQPKEANQVARSETGQSVEASPQTQDAVDQLLEETDSPEMIQDLSVANEPADRAADVSETLVDMPLQELDGVMVVGAETAEIENVFVIGALDDVRVEVFIDGYQKTNRLLQKGMVRAYTYGRYHTITVYDASKVSIQEGRELLEIPKREGEVLSLLDWQPGELQSRIESWAQSSHEPTATDAQ